MGGSIRIGHRCRRLWCFVGIRGIPLGQGDWAADRWRSRFQPFKRVTHHYPKKVTIAELLDERHKSRTSEPPQAPVPVHLPWVLHGPWQTGGQRSELWKHLEMKKCRSTTWKWPIISYPMGSMHGIFNYIDLIFMVNVGKYTIHGLFGYWLISEYGLVVSLNEACHPNELLPWR